MQRIEQPVKLCSPDVAGRLSLKMTEHMLHDVTSVREQVTALREMRCHDNQYMYVKYFMFGE